MASAVLSALLAGALLGAPCAPSGEERGGHRREASIPGLIQLWTHQDPARRADATAQLEAMGSRAWPDLQNAADNHPDPEVRARANELLLQQRLRRQLPHSLLEKHPDAAVTLLCGATDDKLRLIRTLGENCSRFAPILRPLLGDPDPEVVLTACEVLYDNRDHSWAPTLLQLYLTPHCPRPDRAGEILSRASHEVPDKKAQELFNSADDFGRRRLLELANRSGGFQLTVPDGVLTAFLACGDAERAHAALGHIRAHRIDRLAPEVRELLDPRHPGAVTEDAVFTLRRLRAPVDPDRAAELLRHEHRGVRYQALRLVCDLPGPAFAADLRRLLEDPSPRLREFALHALWKRTGEEALPDVLRVFLRDTGDPHETALEILSQHRAWCLDRALKLAESPDAELRLSAAQLLLSFDGPASLDRWIEDPAESVRAWTLETARSSSGPHAGELITAFLEDPSAALRFEATKELALRGDPDAVQALADYAGSGEYQQRVEASKLHLSLSGRDQGAELARSLAAETDATLCRIGLEALDDRSLCELWPRALDLLETDCQRLRAVAARYLRHAAASNPPHKVARAVAGRLARLEGRALESALDIALTFGDRSTRDDLLPLIRGRKPGSEHAITTILFWSPGHVPQTALELLDDDPERLRHLLDAAETFLSRAAEFPDRADDIEALRADLRQGRLFYELMRLTRHRNPDLRRAAARAAGDLRLRAAAPSLRGRLRDPEAPVRHAAILALHALNDHASVPLIAPLLDDDDPDVRLAAADAVCRLGGVYPAPVQQARTRETCAWVRDRMSDLLQSVPDTGK